ncbi:MAG TPA: peptidoglycan DD-metalloendopeptidase family protein [Candidatus Binatia bacterium]|nr:peptidoglycan DD-metalloendopeptidase family protein [Candidatus Binatia bacterium]
MTVDRTTTLRTFVAGKRATQQFFIERHINILAFLATLLVAIGWSSFEAQAAKQKTVRKQPSKGKPDGVPVAARKPAGEPAQKKGLLRPSVSPPVDNFEKREHIVHRVKAGETFAQVLARYYVPDAEKQFWLRSITRTAGAQALASGKEIHLYFAKPPIQRPSRPTLGQLKAVEYDQNDAFTLTWEKGIRGILFQKRERPYDVEIKTVSATIEHSLFEDALKAGIQPALITQLAEIFTWDLDLEKDVRKGDSFRILYEQRTRKGREIKTGLRILAAELTNAGQKLSAIYFEKQKGQGNYYNLEGRSLARAFLRFPLEFTSITSHFAESRFHPILKTNLPHPGIDFAAPRGTPVRAIGDGVILEAGWNGGYGKAIDLKHDAAYTSRYAHLDSFAPGIRPGVTVTKGQVIGYVGSTGRTTGPHLHFELYKDQQYIDPLSVEFPAEEDIEPALQRLFENQMRTYLAELTLIPQS